MAIFNGKLWIVICWISILTVTDIMASGTHHQIHKMTLSPSQTEVVHYINDSYIVKCSIHNLTRIRWLSPTQNVIEDTKGRIHVEEKSNGELTLVFELISLADKGEWQCQSEIENLQKSFTMIVSEPISFMDTPVIQSAREDQDAMIRCMVKGDPEPTVSWYFNGQSLPLPSPKFTKVADGLVVKKVTKNDSGEYTCKAFQISTTISNVKEQTIRLNVQHKPMAPPRKASADIQFGYIHGIVNLTCEAEAEPAANFTWYRHNKKINSNVHLMHTEGHVSVLQIIVNDTKAFGDYKCKAQNSFGTLERTISLSEGTKPERPSQLTLRGVNSDTLDIDVGASKITKTNKPMDIKGYRFEITSLTDFTANGRKWDGARILLLDFDEDVTYLINNLASNTTYYVRVAARNLAGLSDWMGPKEFKTHPKEPLGLMPNNASLNRHTQLETFSFTIVVVAILQCYVSAILLAQN